MGTPFVLDASVTLTWAFDDEHSVIADRAEALLSAASAVAVVPELWWYEVRNILLVGERRKRITPEASASFLRQLANINAEVDSLKSEGHLLDICRRHHLTVYDAAYLALAMRRAIPLATLDRALEAAAIAEGIKIVA